LVYWGSLLIEIDEHLALAKYFIIHGDTLGGKVDLFKRYIKMKPLCKQSERSKKNLVTPSDGLQMDLLQMKIPALFFTIKLNIYF
jgi:hypothetical protein